MAITRINPDTLFKSPVFTQVATVSAGSTLIFVGGQNGVRADGTLAGKDIGAQAAQAYQNVVAALAAAGASMEDVVKMTIYIVQGQSLQDAFAAVGAGGDWAAAPPTVTGLFVAGLTNPDYLIEIEAIAAVRAEAAE
jgi:enamine deaminase RidA (YjgF/YER057c/UK114 family)